MHAASEWRRPPTFNAETRQWESAWPKLFLAAIVSGDGIWHYAVGCAGSHYELMAPNGEHIGWKLADVDWIANINAPRAQ